VADAKEMIRNSDSEFVEFAIINSSLSQLHEYAYFARGWWCSCSSYQKGYDDLHYNVSNPL